MSKRTELLVWANVAFGIVLFVVTFLVAWNSTDAYRANIHATAPGQQTTTTN